MAEAEIPVDLFNPGQVFACLGFMEAAEILLGDAEGGFDWSREADEGVKFHLRAAGAENPVEAVLAFLAEAEVLVITPNGVDGPWPNGSEPSKIFPAPTKALRKSNGKTLTNSTLPVKIKSTEKTIIISNWMKSDSRPILKLFAGQQVGSNLIKNMLEGDPTKKGSKGFRDVYRELKDQFSLDPFQITCPVGGRFGFDARGSWDAMRSGFSIDNQKMLVTVSQLVEILSIIGLENTRPNIPSNYQLVYAVWSQILPISLSRLAFFSPEVFLPENSFQFFQTHLGDDKQYKKVFFAECVERS